MKKKVSLMTAGGLPLFLVVIVMALVLLSGCSALKSKPSSSGSGSMAAAPAKAENAPTYYDFGDVLIPHEMKIDKKESFVFRSPGMTVGMLSIKGRVDSHSLADFFANKLPVDGWHMVSSIEGQRTMMLFQKNNRWCVINIAEGGLSTTAEIFVSTSVSSSTGLRK
jgi:hypothetical protein